MMPNLPWTFFKVAAKTTAKGAAVTLTSTVVSCTLACYIEIGAHRLVYHYAPYKYANVEFASGLTQAQLDAVRVHQKAATAIPVFIEGVLGVESEQNTNSEADEPDQEFSTTTTTTLRCEPLDQTTRISRTTLQTRTQTKNDGAESPKRNTPPSSASSSSSSVFWREEEEETHNIPETDRSQQSSLFSWHETTAKVFSSSEILACAMTG